MKKLIALLLALVMVFALVACASGETKTETPTTEEPAKTEEPKAEEPAAEEPAAEEPAAEEGTLYIPVMAKGFQHQFWQAVKAGS